MIATEGRQRRVVVDGLDPANLCSLVFRIGGCDSRPATCAVALGPQQ